MHVYSNTPHVFVYTGHYINNIKGKEECVLPEEGEEEATYKEA